MQQVVRAVFGLPAPLRGLQWHGHLQVSMMRRLAVIAILLVSRTATAQDAPTPTPTPTRSEPPEVRVIGNKPDSLQRIPGSGTVIGEKDIQRAQPTEAAEMLRRVPGVQVRQEFGSGGRLDIGIRGLEAGRSRRVLVLEDGIPVSLNPYAEPDMYYAPPIERMRAIEVVKGSGSILFGPQTIGGVVNFLTVSPPPRPHAVVDGEGGQYGYARGLASYGDTFSGARYVVQALYRRGDGFRNQAFESTNVLGKVAFDTSDTGEAILKIGFHDDAADSDDVGLTREMYARDPRRSTLAPADRLHLRRYDVSLTHEQRFGTDTKLRTLLYAYDTNRIWRRQNYTRAGFSGMTYDRILGDTAQPSGAIYFLPTNTVLDRDYQVAGLEPRFETRFETGGVGHTLDYGARILGETALYEQRSGEIPTSWSGSLDQQEKHRTIAFAAYAQDRIAFRENLLVTPGLRAEYASFHRIVLRQDDGTGPHDASLPGDRVASGLVPGIGMVYGSRNAHVFGGLHVGWAPPRITSSISPKGAPSELNAEESINWEIGSRLAPNKWLRGEVTAFASKFMNQVVLNTGGASAAQTTEIDAGETRHVGVETGAVVQIARALGWETALDVGARYTFVRATFAAGPNAGNLLPYAPVQSLSANVDLEHKAGLGGQIAWTHVSSQFTDVQNTVAEDATGRLGLAPAHTIVDVTARYRHKASGITVRLMVKNLLDATYIAARRPEGIFTGGYRQILLGVRWEWQKTGDASHVTQL